MPFRNVADPDQLQMLTAVLADYCRLEGIDPKSGEGIAIGRIIMTHFQSGIDEPEALRKALNVSLARNAFHAIDGGESADGPSPS